MIFPISDDDRHLVKPAWVTIALLAANVVLFLFQYLNPDFTSGWSVVPQEITTGVDLVEPTSISVNGMEAFVEQKPGPALIYLTIFSAMFMHGSLAHLGGNMLFLWIFGDNVEHRFGAKKFLALYLISGVVATFAQIAIDPDSVIPTLGASGALSGVWAHISSSFRRTR